MAFDIEELEKVTPEYHQSTIPGLKPRTTPAALSATKPDATADSTPSLDMNGCTLSLVSRIEGHKVFVDVPARLDALGRSATLVREYVRFTPAFRLYLDQHTSGSRNAVINALLAFALEELERTGQVLSLVKPEAPAPVSAPTTLQEDSHED